MNGFSLITKKGFSKNNIIAKKTSLRGITVFYDLFKILLIYPQNQVLVKGHHALSYPPPPTPMNGPIPIPTQTLYFST